MIFYLFFLSVFIIILNKFLLKKSLLLRDTGDSHQKLASKLNVPLTGGIFIFLGFFITFLRLPAVLLLGVWIFGQVISAMLSDPGSPGVAWFAHLGGFACGLILGPLMKKRGVNVFQPARARVKEKPIRIRFRNR